MALNWLDKIVFAFRGWSTGTNTVKNPYGATGNGTSNDFSAIHTAIFGIPQGIITLPHRARLEM
jgi:hypothetical protein